MSRIRVINLGLPKSGTTTLGHALKVAGLKVADFRIRPHQTKDTSLHRAYVGDLMYRGYFHADDPLDGLEEFDAFTEISTLRQGRSLWPQTDWALIASIRARHPGARFLASYRDPRAVSDSMLRWSDLGTDRLPNNMIPGLPDGFGQTTAERVKWIEGHYANLRRFFENADDFLEYDVTDPNVTTKISAHIGTAITLWGKANANPATDEGEAA